MKKLIHCHNASMPWAHNPRQIFEYGLSLGVAASKMLDAANLDASDLKNAELSISWPQYRSLVAEVDRKAPDAWGFFLGASLHAASHGMLSLLLLNCISWKQMMESVGRYGLLISPLVYMRKRESAEYVSLTAYPEFVDGELLPQFLLMYLTSVYQTMVEVGGIDFRNNPEKMCVLMPGEPPAAEAEMRSFFHENVRWGSYGYQLRIHKDIVNSDIDSPDPRAASSTLQILHSQLAQLPGRKGYMRELGSLFARGCYRLEDCAKALHCSGPTLKRYLRQSSTTFSAQLRRFRLDEACWQLQETDASTAEIANQLGFEDTGSFRRMFREGLGLSPQEYRAQSER